MITNTVCEDRFVAWARELGTVAREHAPRHDREGSFVCEAYDALRGSGYLALPVPRSRRPGAIRRS
jgi:hypothetical protein